uniref:Uncharacterized protein n=1 Tax=Clandestinovirus TaxID=2831644 RepID=A0A8F8KPB3_9VIRU|nr:hypothetical protein KOM_12_40 [Clandestinovirus]
MFPPNNIQMSSIRDHPWYQRALPKLTCKCTFCKDAFEMDVKEPEYIHTMAGTRISILGSGDDLLYFTLNGTMVPLDTIRDSVDTVPQLTVDEKQTTTNTGLDQLTNRLDTLLF